jgi:hypothetical protein
LLIVVPTLPSIVLMAGRLRAVSDTFNATFEAVGGDGAVHEITHRCWLSVNFGLGK